MGLWLYRCLIQLLNPAIKIYLWQRVARNKEDPARVNEKLGYPSQSRPDGQLIWIHAASVGETVSIIPIIRVLLNDCTNMTVLLTTCSTTSATIAATISSERVIHQYAPLDGAKMVRRFLDHWHPDLGVIVESELWPNLILAAKRRGISLALVNARMSSRSYERWKNFPSIIRPLLDCFDLFVPQSEIDAGRYKTLGAKNVVYLGNLKKASGPLIAESEDIIELSTSISNRPTWIAASTHPKEEKILAAAHVALAKRHPQLLTILIPRHADRGSEIAKNLSSMNIKVAQRSKEKKPHGDTEIFIGDSIGEMGLYYRIARIVFIGGSLVKHGGHNPLEPARLDNALISGPYMYNFEDISSELKKAKAIKIVDGISNLIEEVENLLSDPSLIEERASAAKLLAGENLNIATALVGELRPMMPKGICM